MREVWSGRKVNESEVGKRQNHDYQVRRSINSGRSRLPCRSLRSSESLQNSFLDSFSLYLLADSDKKLI